MVRPLKLIRCDSDFFGDHTQGCTQTPDHAQTQKSVSMPKPDKQVSIAIRDLLSAVFNSLR